MVTATPEVTMTQLVKNKRWPELFRMADEAGDLESRLSKPTPMVVSEHENPFDDNSPVNQSWYVSEGVCGFAWVVFKPATHSFVKWMKEQGHAGPNYGGGYSVWVRGYGQSMQRKEAYARAFAEVLRQAFDEKKLRIYAQSRMD